MNGRWSESVQRDEGLKRQVMSTLRLPIRMRGSRFDGSLEILDGPFDIQIPSTELVIWVTKKNRRLSREWRATFPAGRNVKRRSQDDEFRRFYEEN